MCSPACEKLGECDLCDAGPEPKIDKCWQCGGVLNEKSRSTGHPSYCASCDLDFWDRRERFDELL